MSRRLRGYKFQVEVCVALTLGALCVEFAGSSKTTTTLLPTRVSLLTSLLLFSSIYTFFIELAFSEPVDSSNTLTFYLGLKKR